MRRTLLTVSEDNQVCSGRTMNSRRKGMTNQRGKPGGPHSLRFSSYEMPLASSSFPLFNAAAAAGVSLGDTPVGPRPKNEPPPEAVHNPDQSGNRAKGGDCSPPWAVDFSAVYSSNAVPYFRPMSNMRCHSVWAWVRVWAATIVDVATINRSAGNFLIRVIAGSSILIAAGPGLEDRRPYRLPGPL